MDGGRVHVDPDPPGHGQVSSMHSLSQSDVTESNVEHSAAGGRQPLPDEFHDGLVAIQNQAGEALVPGIPDATPPSPFIGLIGLPNRFEVPLTLGLRRIAHDQGPYTIARNGQGTARFDRNASAQ